MVEGGSVFNTQIAGLPFTVLKQGKLLSFLHFADNQEKHFQIQFDDLHDQSLFILAIQQAGATISPSDSPSYQKEISPESAINPKAFTNKAFEKIESFKKSLSE